LVGSAYERGDAAAVRSLFEESIVLNREAGNKTNIAYSLLYLAYSDLLHGEYAGTRCTGYLGHPFEKNHQKNEKRRLKTVFFVRMSQVASTGLGVFPPHVI